MAEILVMARSNTHEDPEVDRTQCYKRGMPVVVMPDGHPWGSAERLPTFVLLKLPGVPVELVQKYVEEHPDPASPGEPSMLLRRVWTIRWDDLPAEARGKLAGTGQIVIQAGGYSGEYDYTWKQIKRYFRNQVTGLDEDGNL